MSQVKIQGNATGTGIFTIAAPNSNTDRTLTLPDSTGTVVAKSSTYISTSDLASGTANSTTYLRGDSTWQTISTTPTTAQVLSATAGAVFNDVGSYGLFYQNTASNIAVNGTVAGSALRKINTSGVNASAGASGTWRMLGYQETNDTNGAICLWLRIS